MLAVPTHPADPALTPVTPRCRGKIIRRCGSWDAALEQVAAWRRAGQSLREMCRDLGHCHASSVMALLRKARAKYGAEQVPLARHCAAKKARRKPKASPKKHTARWTLTRAEILNKVADLWQQGLSSPEIDARLKPDLAGDTYANCVPLARRALGEARVPLRRQPKIVQAPRVPITMAELDKYFARRVADEFIYRDTAGNEEVWVKTDEPTGILHRQVKSGLPGKTAIKLKFKCNLQPIHKIK